MPLPFLGFIENTLNKITAPQNPFIGQFPISMSTQGDDLGPSPKGPDKTAANQLRTPPCFHTILYKGTVAFYGHFFGLAKTEENIIPILPIMFDFAGQYSMTAPVICFQFSRVLY